MFNIRSIWQYLSWKILNSWTIRYNSCGPEMIVDFCLNIFENVGQIFGFIFKKCRLIPYFLRIDDCSFIQSPSCRRCYNSNVFGSICMQRLGALCPLNTFQRVQTTCRSNPHQTPVQFRLQNLLPISNTTKRWFNNPELQDGDEDPNLILYKYIQLGFCNQNFILLTRLK